MLLGLITRFTLTAKPSQGSSQLAGIAQLARASPFQGEGCRFESDYLLYWVVSSDWLEHCTCTAGVKGSSPLRSTKSLNDYLYSNHRRLGCRLIWFYSITWVAPSSREWVNDDRLSVTLLNTRIGVKG